MADAYATPDKPTPRPTDGYFTLRENGDGRIVFVHEVGDNPTDKWQGRCFNSQEKGMRLFGNPDHVSSWESRDVREETEQKKYGGAIRAGAFILSFSGLPEQADETLCLVIALDLGWIDIHNAESIVRKSKNEIGIAYINKMLVESTR